MQQFGVLEFKVRGCNKPQLETQELLTTALSHPYLGAAYRIIL